MSERTITVNADWYAGVTADIAGYKDRITKLEAAYDHTVKDNEDLVRGLDWLNNHITFYEPNGHNKPALDSASKRIWYHATNDTNSYPFSDVIDKALKQGNDDG